MNRLQLLILRTFFPRLLLPLRAVWGPRDGTPRRGRSLDSYTELNQLRHSMTAYTSAHAKDIPAPPCILNAQQRTNNMSPVLSCGASVLQAARSHCRPRTGGGNGALKACPTRQWRQLYGCCVGTVASQITGDCTG